MNGREILNSAWKQDHGFLTPAAVRIIAADPETRLFALLVRCGNGRFLAPAQDVEHFSKIIAEHYELTNTVILQDGAWPERDYIRDISIPAGYEPTAPKGQEQAPRKPGRIMRAESEPRRSAAAGTRNDYDDSEGHSDADPGL